MSERESERGIDSLQLLCQLTSGPWESSLSADVQPNKDFGKHPSGVTLSEGYL